jgi:hypothetical protein
MQNAVIHVRSVLFYLVLSKLDSTLCHAYVIVFAVFRLCSCMSFPIWLSVLLAWLIVPSKIVTCNKTISRSFTTVHCTPFYTQNVLELSSQIMSSITIFCAVPIGIIQFHQCYSPLHLLFPNCVTLYIQLH